MPDWIDHLPDLGPAPVIVDGGTNKGRLALALRQKFPLARIVAVEPLPALARKLRKRFADDPRLEVVEAALGAAPGRAELLAPASRTLSSLLPPTGVREKYADRDFDALERFWVEVVRLDDLLPEGADLVKLDLQGYELEALRGAPNLLRRAAAVLSETAFAPLYAGQALFPELEAFLTTRGFRLAGLFDVFTGAGGERVSADALFVRDG